MRRHDDLGHTEFATLRHAEPGAAKRHDGVAARIAPAFGRDLLDGAYDIRFGKLDDAVRELFHGDVERLRQRREGPARRRGIDFHFPTEKRSARTLPRIMCASVTVGTSPPRP